jgi:hypothetical protein
MTEGLSLDWQTLLRAVVPLGAAALAFLAYRRSRTEGEVSIEGDGQGDAEEVETDLEHGNSRTEGFAPIDRAAHVDADAVEGDSSELLRYAPAPFARSRAPVERPTAAARHRVAALGVLAVLGGATVAVLFTSRPLADVEIAVASARPASCPPRRACATQPVVSVSGTLGTLPAASEETPVYVLLRRPSSQTWTLGGEARADSTGAWAVDGMRAPEGAEAKVEVRAVIGPRSMVGRVEAVDSAGLRGSRIVSVPTEVGGTSGAEVGAPVE